MSQFSELAGDIASAIGGISNIGQVYARQRYDAGDLAKYLDLLTSSIGGTPQVRAWMVRRTSVDGEPGPALGEKMRTHHFAVVGVMEFVDGADSYTAFQGLVEAVCDVLDAKKDWGRSYVVDYSGGPCSVSTFGEELVGNVFCHVVEIAYSVQTWQSVAYA